MHTKYALKGDVVKKYEKKCFYNMNFYYAFSLIELLIGMIIISALLAAFMPIITKKLNSSTTIIKYIQQEKKSEVRRKEFIAAGEYDFLVPEGVNEIKATLISGAEGGGAGEGDMYSLKITNIGESYIEIPPELRNKYALVDMCGAGGAGGGAASNVCWNSVYRYQGAGGGGSGGYYLNKIVKFANTASTYVFVGGGGGKVDNCSGGSLPLGIRQTTVWDPYFVDTTLEISVSTQTMITGAPAEDGTGGQGGSVHSSMSIFEGMRRGGYGGKLNGGSGSSFFGHCGLSGGGGGGGGASRLGTPGESHYLYVGGGGGGGGEPVFFNYNSDISRSGGGGGGGGGTGLGGNGGDSNELNYGCIATGGGGGKPGGNSGGNSECASGVNYNGYFVANSGKGGASPLESLYNGYCGGGHGAGYNNSYNDRTYGTPEYWLSSSIKQYGLDGIIVIKYLKAKSGGKGGNSGKKVTKTISVNPNETYKIIVGDGSNGAKSKYINSSGTVVQSVPAETIKHSYIYKDGIKILGTDDTNATFQDSISSTSLLGSKGAALSGVSTCYVGDGGTLESQDGTAALGYGGCGGGGGYGLANGGKGACGYVLLEWEELQE